MTAYYSDEVAAIAIELDIEHSVALDIHYLRMLEKRIVEHAKKNPRMRDYPVFNQELEELLDDQS